MANESIRTVVAHTNGAIRSAIRGTLQTKGFRAITDASAMVNIHDGLQSNLIDLLVTSTKLGYEETPVLIQEMRHQRLGDNPFVVVILLLEDASPEVVRKIVSTGADDMLLVPVSPGQILSRVEGLVRTRKRFVVTHDYVGPDRRKEDRPGQAPPTCFEPPNPLSLRGNPAMDDARFRQLIRSGSEKLNRVAVSVQARQLKWLGAQIKGVEGEPPVTAATKAGFAVRVVTTGQEVMRRITGETASTHLPALNEITDLARAIQESPSAVPGEMIDRIKVLTTFIAQELG